MSEEKKDPFISPISWTITTLQRLQQQIFKKVSEGKIVGKMPKMYSICTSTSCPDVVWQLRRKLN